MRLFHSILLPGVCVLAGVAACSSSSQNGPQSGDGTTPVSATQATTSAVVTGQVDTSVSGNVQMSVNHTAKPLLLAPDQSFVVRDVPTGDVVLGCDAGDVHGEITIKHVHEGEIIQVLVKREGDAIVIVIVERTESSQPPCDVDQRDGDALVIRASHACYWLHPGHYKRDVIVKGSDVHIFGAAHESCDADGFSVLDGKLELDGDHITVLDVDLTGALVIGGHDCKVQDSCTRCYDDSCVTPDAGSTSSDAGVPPEQDATVPPQQDAGGVPGQDAGPSQDAGTSHDAGGSTDAGVSRDAATGGG